MSPGIKGFIVAIVLSLLFLGAGILLKDQFSKKYENRKTQVAQMEKEGAIDFELPTLNGEPFRLSSLKGTVTIVNFWATWCAPCVEEFPSMVKLLREFDGQVKIVAVSVDESKDDVLTFLKAFEAFDENLIVLLDPENQLSGKYGTVKLPESYIFGKDMKLVKKIASTENWAQPMVINYFKDLVNKGAGSVHINGEPQEHQGALEGNQ